MPARAKPPIALLTDFGYRDHYVGAMKGVIAGIAPAATIIDITHGVPAQSITAGALALRESWRYFSRGTIFVGVVDPGVGTARLPIAIATRARATFVGPDNGLLALAAKEAKIARVVQLSTPRYRLERVSSTFHGRDIFAPAAAWLWRGVALTKLGPAVKKIVPLELPSAHVSHDEIVGTVIYQDSFGNLVTSISRDSVTRLMNASPSRKVCVKIGGSAPMPVLGAYGEAREGATLATFGSFELLEIAVRDGNAAARFGSGAAVVVQVVK